MTHANDLFQLQYRATGSKKADGYDPACFDGMTPQERADAFALLREEARVDPNDAKWLFYLDPMKAEAECKALLLAYSPNNAPFILLYHLQRNTGRLEYQHEMIARYPQAKESHKSMAVSYIAGTPHTAEQLAFLRHVVLTETNALAVGGAAIELLRAHGLPYVTDADKAAFRAMHLALKTSAPADKAALMDKLDVDFPIALA